MSVKLMDNVYALAENNQHIYIYIFFFLLFFLLLLLLFFTV